MSLLLVPLGVERQGYLVWAGLLGAVFFGWGCLRPSRSRGRTLGSFPLRRLDRVPRPALLRAGGRGPRGARAIDRGGVQHRDYARQVRSRSSLLSLALFDRHRRAAPSRVGARAAPRAREHRRVLSLRPARQERHSSRTSAERSGSPISFSPAARRRAPCSPRGCDRSSGTSTSARVPSGASCRCGSCRFRSIPRSIRPTSSLAYAAKWGADERRWLFLTGPLDEMNRAVTRGMKIPSRKAAPTRRHST